MYFSQVGDKSLYFARSYDRRICVYKSYDTPVVFILDDTAYIPIERYSVTTSRHINLALNIEGVEADNVYKIRAERIHHAFLAFGALYSIDDIENILAGQFRLVSQFK